MAEHFVQAPGWGWWIAAYFFTAGIAGGAYVLATMLRLWGTSRDLATARFGFLLAFPLAVLCAIFLTIDLGQPSRFWHMMINTTPGAGGLNFKYYSPISLGTWALLIFSIFAFVSFLEAYTKRDEPSTMTRAWEVAGSLVALFLCSYTGVVLSVSNQPVWSDSWAIGGLFLASALSGSAALLAWRAGTADGEPATEARLRRADGYFAGLELLLIVIFFVTLAAAGTLSKTLGGVWLVLWILVIVSLLPSLATLRGARARAGGGAAAGAGSNELMMALVVIVGVALMRIVVVFSAQS